MRFRAASPSYVEQNGNTFEEHGRKIGTLHSATAAEGIVLHPRTPSPAVPYCFCSGIPPNLYIAIDRQVVSPPIRGRIRVHFPIDEHIGSDPRSFREGKAGGPDN